METLRSHDCSVFPMAEHVQTSRRSDPHRIGPVRCGNLIGIEIGIT